jgi:hypothetical protein
MLKVWRAFGSKESNRTIFVSQSLHEEELVVEKMKQLGIRGYVHKLRLATILCQPWKPS